MKCAKVVSLIFPVFVLSSCCESEITDTYSLTDYEKSLITVTEYIDIQYVDQNNSYWYASTQPKEHVIYNESAGAESCKYTQNERLWTFLNFVSKSFAIQIELVADHGTTFSLCEYGINAPSSGDCFGLDCNGPYLPIEERVTDISIQGFDFTNIFVFENCTKKSSIKRILYSTENGIEFIEYANGDYLKFCKKMLNQT
jgi:hypothetical protein